MVATALKIKTEASSGSRSTAQIYTLPASVSEIVRPAGDAGGLPIVVPPPASASVEIFQDFYKEALTALARLNDLEPGWDGYDAPPISRVALDRAKAFLFLAQQKFAARVGEEIKPSEVGPLQDGGVQLEWLRPGFELYVQLARSGKLGHLLITGSPPNENYRESTEANLLEVMRLLSDFLLLS